MIYIVDRVMQYCEEVGLAREKVCLVHCMPAMQPAKDFGKPRRWHTGSQAVPLHSPVPTSSMLSNLRGTLSAGFALELSTICTHSNGELESACPAMD